MKVCLLSLTDLAKLLKNGVVEVTVDSEKIILMIKPREIVENVKFKKGGRRMRPRRAVPSHAEPGHAELRLAAPRHAIDLSALNLFKLYDLEGAELWKKPSFWGKIILGITCIIASTKASAPYDSVLLAKGVHYTTALWDDLEAFFSK